MQNLITSSLLSFLMAAACLAGPGALVVDTNAVFTRIRSGPIATDRKDSNSPAWADYDSDGDVDLFIAHFGGATDDLYRNDGQGVFTRMTVATAGSIVGQSMNGLGQWADFDNDGFVDLFEVNFNGAERLHRNLGNGLFSLITPPPSGRDIPSSFGCALADYDRDGYVDAVICQGSPNGDTRFMGLALLQNQRGNSFARITNAAAGTLVTNRASWLTPAWGDYDNDGDLDLFVAANTAGGSKRHLYNNQGNGSFEPILHGPVLASPGSVYAASWADYDNNGLVDLFVSNADGRPNDLYRNLGKGVFERVEQGPVVTDRTSFCAPGAWADYDNDGHLDLYVGTDGRNFLYRNNGDGTFTKITAGEIVNDPGDTPGTAWGDFDNDGFMDLAVANGGGGGPQLNYVYRNEGNRNAWLKLRLVGTASNRTAIGAKVRLKSRIGGQDRWQLREISGGTGGHQDDPRPNFGLGDATLAEWVRIEWPSGIIQELRNVQANQILHVTEPLRLAPALQVRDGVAELKVQCWDGFRCRIEASRDLILWTPVATATTSGGNLHFPDPEPLSSVGRFYRVRLDN